MNIIHVSQGHEKSIGLEVFLKSFLLLDNDKQSQFILYAFTDSLKETLDSINVSYSIDEDLICLAGSYLKLKSLERNMELSESLVSLKSAISNIQRGDVLLTIPTTKSQLKEGEITFSGHTDYFRKKFPDTTPVMIFKSKNSYVSLLTEHIPLSEVEEKITKPLVINKVKTLLNSHFEFNQFIFSGINPHCGEEGLMGSADHSLKEYIKELSTSYPHIQFLGPLSGDTLPLKATSATSCLIAANHDQGLAPLKGSSGFRAVNITAGLPFLRVSPDHGTAFDLYGKNRSNYLGMHCTICEALNNLGNK